MRKSVYIMFVLAMSVMSVSGQSVIKPVAYFETGWEKSRDIIYLKDNVDLPMVWNDVNAYYGMFYVSGEFKNFKAYTSNKTYFNKDKELNYANPYFSPIQSEFNIGLHYNLKAFYFGYEHDCVHDFEFRKTSYSYDRLYVRVYLTKK
jgi:hypothetical protein